MRPKKYFISIYLLCVCSACAIHKKSISVLPEISIDADWTFNYFPETEEPVKSVAPGYNDDEWPAVALPHTWSVFETTGDKHPFIKNPSEQDNPYWWKGWGSYRKQIFFGKELEGTKVFIEFDGVQKYSRIYLNGQFVNDHKGGFNSFSVDITDKIKWGEQNLLAVTVSNRRDDKYRIPPMTAGNWNLYGGIYRSARLVIKNRLYIPYQGNAEHDGGTFVATPEINHDSALVNIKTYVKNEFEETKDCLLETQIFNPKGELEKTIKTHQKINAGKTFEFEQQTIIKKPFLWSPEHPNLYKVKTRVMNNGVESDNYQSPLGMRWFKWDYNTNDLYVNGSKINIKGINRHQEYPWLGDAIPKFITKSDLIDIKVNMGHNFMRAAHYPNDPYLYQLADSLGIIMVEEVPNIKSIDFSEEVQKENVKEMIRRDRNHPSIFFWSMGNETSDAADSKWAVEEDTTRIIHLRKGENGGDFIEHTDKNLDLEQLLRVTIRGWFNKQDAPKGFSSEPENGQFASNETWQWKNAMIKGGSTRGILGQNCSAWVYADHGCDREYLNSPLNHVNAKGWVDAYREPKYIYYLTKALYTDIPVIYIHPDVWRTNYINQSKNIIVDSNCDEAELFVNGISKGKRYPLANAFPTVKFENIKVVSGIIKIVGIKQGKRYEETLSMPGKPYRIVLKTQQKQIKADRAGIALVKANILDEKGNPVFDASNALTWNVSGEGRLVGMPVYESDIMKHEATEGSGYTIVPVTNVVRSTNKPGDITVTVSSPGLKSATVKIKSIPQKHFLYSYIKLPAVSEKGRKSVEKNQGFYEKINFKIEIKNLPGNILLSGANNITYQKALIDFIKENNPGLNINNDAFQYLVEKLAISITQQKGELVADDYNFITNKYNQYITLYRLIESKNFPKQYEKQLKEFYLKNLIIDNNQSIDFSEAFKKIGNTPSQQTVVIIRNPNKQHLNGEIQKDNVLHTTTVYVSSVEQALSYLYPGFANKPDSVKNNILKFIDSINPQFSYNKSDGLQDQDTLSLKSLDGKMLFIPDVKFLDKL